MESQKVNRFQRCLDQPITGMRSPIKFKGLPHTSHYLHHIIAIAQFASEAACRMKRSCFTMPTSPLTVDDVGFDHNTGGRPGLFGLGFTKELQTHKQALLNKSVVTRWLAVSCGSHPSAVTQPLTRLFTAEHHVTATEPRGGAINILI